MRRSVRYVTLLCSTAAFGAPRQAWAPAPRRRSC